MEPESNNRCWDNNDDNHDNDNRVSNSYESSSTLHRDFREVTTRGPEMDICGNRVSFKRDISITQQLVTMDNEAATIEIENLHPDTTAGDVKVDHIIVHCSFYNINEATLVK
ncbi:hypothetical protein BGZ49_004714 [Haplosporangium sp. Z 27]|nr:hypothetical protein BGZ49_004714 [Haplosporangium sp. Z 27]